MAERTQKTFEGGPVSDRGPVERLKLIIAYTYADVEPNPIAEQIIIKQVANRDAYLLTYLTPGGPVDGSYRMLRFTGQETLDFAPLAIKVLAFIDETRRGTADAQR